MPSISAGRRWLSVLINTRRELNNRSSINTGRGQVMAEIKLTKTELRSQQLKLDRLRKYLPTLQLKKAMLQVEVNQAQMEIQALFGEFAAFQEKVAKYSSLLTERSAPDLFSAVKIHQVERTHENV